MTAERFHIMTALRVFGWGSDGTARFFLLPPQAVIDVLSACASSGRVQLLYDQQIYVTLERSLIAHLKRERDLSAT